MAHSPQHDGQSDRRNGRGGLMVKNGWGRGAAGGGFQSRQAVDYITVS